MISSGLVLIGAGVAIIVFAVKYPSSVFNRGWWYAIAVLLGLVGGVLFYVGVVGQKTTSGAYYRQGVVN